MASRIEPESSPDRAPTLPIDELAPQVLREPGLRPLYQLARLFFLFLALFVLLTFVVLQLPSLMVPRSKSFEVARRFLQQSSLLKRQLGAPLEVAELPQAYLYEEGKLGLSIKVVGSYRRAIVEVVVAEAEAGPKVIKARIGTSNLLRGP